MPDRPCHCEHYIGAFAEGLRGVCCARSGLLDSEAIVEFVRALCYVAQEELRPVAAPRVYSLTKIVEISHFNMSRIRCGRACSAPDLLSFCPSFLPFHLPCHAAPIAQTLLHARPYFTSTAMSDGYLIGTPYREGAGGCVQLHMRRSYGTCMRRTHCD